VGYGAGDSVEVRYDPENPRHARLDSPRARVGSEVKDAVALLIGLVFALVGGLSLWGVARGGPRAGPHRRAARRPRRVGDRASGGDGAGSTPADLRKRPAPALRGDTRHAGSGRLG
jgi:hypothetical protein